MANGYTLVYTGLSGTTAAVFPPTHDPYLPMDALSDLVRECDESPKVAHCRVCSVRLYHYGPGRNPVVCSNCRTEYYRQLVRDNRRRHHAG